MRQYVRTVVLILILLGLYAQVKQEQQQQQHEPSTLPSPSDGLLVTLRKAGFGAFVDVVSASPHLLKVLHGTHSASSGAPQPTWKATVLAPTDAAVASWLLSMGLTMEDLQARPKLAANVAGYHLILEDALQLPAALTSSSAVVSTACPTWDITLSKAPGSNTVVATDAQNRRALVSQQPAARYGNIVIYSIDKLLMNGDFFTTLEAALNYYPQLTSIRTAINRVAEMKALTASPHNELTWFLPMDKGVAGRHVRTDTEPLENLAFELPYHILEGPVQSIPADITPKKQYGTMLTGTVLSIEYSQPKAEPIYPGSDYKVLSALATVITQDQDTSLVVVPNIFVGRSILHVLDKTILAPPSPDMPANLFEKLYGPNGLAQKRPKNLDIISEFMASRALKTNARRLLAAKPETVAPADNRATTKAPAKLNRRLMSPQAIAGGHTTTTVVATRSAAYGYKSTSSLADTSAHVLASVQGAVIVAEPSVSSAESQRLQLSAAKAGDISYNGARHLFA